MDIVEILYSAGETGNGLIKVFGMVGTVLSAVSALRNLFKGNKTVAYRSLCVALILVFVTLINSSRIRVPDVTGLFFDDARRTLLELDLKYSGMMDDNCSVERQSPVAGTVVKKGTEVILFADVRKPTEPTRPSEPVNPTQLTKLPESGYRTIKASSTYNGDRATHIASNLIDNDPKTNWTEGIDGNGEGEYIDIVFKKEEAVAGFEIMAGNHYNDSYYTKNSRPETIVLTFSDGSSQEFSLLDSRTKKTEYFNKVVYTTSIRVAIQSVYPGSDWEDTVISEFAVLVCDSVD